jgi:hypothetical protein
MQLKDFSKTNIKRHKHFKFYKKYFKLILIMINSFIDQKDNNLKINNDKLFHLSQR